MTSEDELQKLADSINLKVQIIWRKDYNKNSLLSTIINMGSPEIGGSHWVAVYRNKYFDSFGLPPPPKMEHLEWTPLQIQNVNYGHCGQYALFWLYYAKKGEIDQFYSQFS